jgi:succinate dehydrogenase/fumarate reductase flavoprotein subunit
MQPWDRTVDVLVVGTGGAGLAAAMSAGDAGMSVLLVESTDRWGGSTSMSGGACGCQPTRSWRATAPATHAMRR